MMRRQSSNGRTQRQLRVGELLREILAEMFARGDVHDVDLEDVSLTVTEVDVSPDLKNAVVYVMPLAGRSVDSVSAALDRCAGFIRGEVGRKAKLKFTPSLTFRIDRTFEEAERIDSLLRTPKVSRDISPPDDDEDGT